MAYSYRLPDWPAFHRGPKLLAAPLAAVRHRQGRLIGRMESRGFALRGEAILRTLTEDVVKSSEIEGAVLDREQVRSSVARRLGIDVGGLVPADRDGEVGVARLLGATPTVRRPLTAAQPLA